MQGNTKRHWNRTLYKWVVVGWVIHLRNRACGLRELWNWMLIKSFTTSMFWRFWKSVIGFHEAKLVILKLKKKLQKYWGVDWLVDEKIQRMVLQTNELECPEASLHHAFFLQFRPIGNPMQRTYTIKTFSITLIQMKNYRQRFWWKLSSQLFQWKQFF